MPTMIEPGLYIGERGDIVCDEHAPGYGTDTWNWGHYIKVNEEFERQWNEARPVLRLDCETCGKTRKEAEA
jgi:hypothetical protein